jgi:ubiquinone/menaquinone biosynthesis C-methylase UbiE
MEEHAECGDVVKHMSDYILGYDELEHQRLEAQAKVLEPATVKALNDIGVAPGWSCLDAACGTGSVMRLLGSMVGPSGKVHGLDLDETYGQRTTKAMNDAGPANYSFQTFDLTGSDTPRGAPFDLVFTRLLLIHMTDPAAVLRRLWSWVKPGGTLLVMDYDLTVTYVYPRNALVDEAMQVMNKAFEATGKDPRMGSALPQLFLTSGPGAADGITVNSAFVPPSPMFASVLKSLLPIILAKKVTTQERFTVLIDAVEQSAREPNKLRRYPDMVAVWKRKAV